ncbi:PREDICTED: uncharacterized protein LOC109583352 isoform X2 [Amphimedon queenslandica]|uniref:JmjC domain-containing protein n=1 Tax=Amphimedon queenslandica TaxID=400682 RepID=A0A1X7UH11_AMPQE|nr:PREDICTED: uncharacterized protein LOC109583352 isoform X2 [Amphimedon queenslandica]|eukprot:XP_019854219.1 PREDICTED: uncharacterized protein LOC109583352 isoform X2 [Amphimedon queenslandica]
MKFGRALASFSCFGGFISVLVGIYYYYNGHQLELSTRSKNNGSRLQWKIDPENPHHMTEYLATLEYPVVITGPSPFSSHKAMEWSFDGLAKDLHKILSCKYSHQPVFTYHAPRQPLNNVPEFSLKEPYQVVGISPMEFFRSIKTSKSDNFFYASGGIELLDLPLSFEDLSNITFPPHKSPSQVNYWFGGSRVTAYTHYDTSHNLHVVIRGHKRFLLSPPKYHSRLYPCLHSLYRQLQVDIEEPQITLDVYPGEVLYLPPYWFHSVITMEPSLSLNIWSDSNDYLLMEEVLNSPIPFETDWGLEELMRSSKYYIDVLIKELKLSPSFVRTSVLSRYQSLLLNISSFDNYGLIVKTYCQPSSFTHAIHDRVSKTSSIFLKMLSPNVMQINVANYIEHIGFTILREEHVIQLPFFLKECF